MPDLYTLGLEIEDELWSKTIIAFMFLTYAVFAMNYMSKVLVSKNKLMPEDIGGAWMYSWLLPASIIDVGTSNSYTVQAPVIQKFNDASRDFEKQMQNINAKVKKLDDEYNTKNDKNKSLAVGIQNSLLSMQEGLYKIAAAVVAQKHMQDGVYTIVKSDIKKVAKHLPKQKG